MLSAVLNTTEENGQTVGKLMIMKDSEVIFTCDTLELPYLNNHRNTSCIPAGEYTCVMNYSYRYKREMYEVLGIYGRFGIRIHPANFVKELRGCIAVGNGYRDLDMDGKKDLLNSKDTYQKLMLILQGKTFKLSINRFGILQII